MVVISRHGEQKDPDCRLEMHGMHEYSRLFVCFKNAKIFLKYNHADPGCVSSFLVRSTEAVFDGYGQPEVFLPRKTTTGGQEL